VPGRCAAASFPERFKGRAVWDTRYAVCRGSHAACRMLYVARCTACICAEALGDARLVAGASAVDDCKGNDQETEADQEQRKHQARRTVVRLRYHLPQWRHHSTSGRERDSRLHRVALCHDSRLHRVALCHDSRSRGERWEATVRARPVSHCRPSTHGYVECPLPQCHSACCSLWRMRTGA
jgi:hypothetical protein